MKTLVAIAALIVLAPAIARADATAEATRLVSASLPAGLAVVSVDVPETVAAAHAAGGAMALSWRRAPRAGTFSIQAVVTGKDRAQTRGWLRIKLAELRAVVVAARPLAAGATIGAGDLALEPRPVGRDAGWEIEPHTLIGASVLADAPAGAVVDGTIVSEPAPVARGTQLKVFVRRGRVRVSTAGVLEAPARPGEIGRVRIGGGRKVARARLVDATSAELAGGID